MTDLLAQIRCLNGVADRAVAEPFAGGAGAALSLLFLEETRRIHINDADPSIFSFWWTVVNRPKPFMKMLRAKRVSMAEWRRQREVYRSTSSTSRLRRGFSAFYLNRCNRSGVIMNGGPIGGMQQQGKWKLDARFNKAGLLDRCERVAEYGSRIRVTNLDGLDFIDSLDSDSTFFFIDPPYYFKGSSLYLDALDIEYHARLARRLQGLNDDAWVLTYDDCPEIRALYEGWATIRPFSLRYSASVTRRGREVLIAPRWMALPDEQTSRALGW